MHQIMFGNIFAVTIHAGPKKGWAKNVISIVTKASVDEALPEQQHIFDQSSITSFRVYCVGPT